MKGEDPTLSLRDFSWEAWVPADNRGRPFSLHPLCGGGQASWSTWHKPEPNNCNTDTLCAEYTSFSKCYLPAGWSSLPCIKQTSNWVNLLPLDISWFTSPLNTHLMYTCVYSSPVCIHHLVCLLLGQWVLFTTLSITSTRSVHACALRSAFIN